MAEFIPARFTHKLAAVFRFIDDFTDQVIDNRLVNVSCGSEVIKPLKKSDGYVTVSGLKEESLNVEIFSPIYNDLKLQINVGELDPLNPLVKVRLIPGKAYRIPEGTTCIMGKTSPNCMVRLVYDCSKNRRKLLYDLPENSGTIFIFNPQAKELEDKQFLIKVKTGAGGEEFTVKNALPGEDGGYAIKPVLQKTYKKASAYILEFSSAYSDDDGNYFMPVKNFKAEEKNTVAIEFFKNKWVKKEVALNEGKVNRFDF